MDVAAARPCLLLPSPPPCWKPLTATARPAPTLRLHLLGGFARLLAATAAAAAAGPYCPTACPTVGHPP
jgi:hypothetical protein